MKEYERAKVIVDLDAIKQNILAISGAHNPKAKIMAVVKTDAYGHGAKIIAQEIEPMQEVCGFCVATSEEAMELREANIQKPILILGYTFESNFEELIQNNITLTVFKKETLEALEQICSKLDQTVAIHFKIDTAMSRIGIEPSDEAIELIRFASNLPHIKVEGIFSHFSRADELDKTHANEQLERFLNFVSNVEKKCGFEFQFKHMGNSAASIELTKAKLDFLRVGISMYGVYPSDDVSQTAITLKQALSLVSQIVLIKTIQAGTSVSYGGTFTAQKEMKVATIPIGYGDGYPRSLSNKGYVLICGKRAPILGRVCMDQFMVDVSNIDEAREGSEVVLVGTSKDETLSLFEIGTLSDRFHYEFSCDISKRIPRVYRSGGELVAAVDYFHHI